MTNSSAIFAAHNSYGHSLLIWITYVGMLRPIWLRVGAGQSAARNHPPSDTECRAGRTNETCTTHKCAGTSQPANDRQTPPRSLGAIKTASREALTGLAGWEWSSVPQSCLFSLFSLFYCLLWLILGSHRFQQVCAFSMQSGLTVSGYIRYGNCVRSNMNYM